MKPVAFVLAVLAVSGQTVLGQSSITPAELPPEGFEGREFVDSRGCIFLRSTFAGEVTWIPRFGPDRQPICSGMPSVDNSAAPVAAAVQSAPEAAVQEPEAPAPAAGSTPQAAPAARAAPRPAQADASGRHRDCPSSAPYGQLVRTAEGRVLVRCVTSPSLFLN